MEADWEVEIGPEAPVIDVLWQGFINLRAEPERIGEIEEARKFPALADALIRLNGSDSTLGCDSPVRTAKCDFWTVDECDPDEMEADSEEAAFGLACYLDLLPTAGLVFPGLGIAEHWARRAVGQLRKVPCRCCRVDLVLRRAFAGDREGLGITAYITACGIDREAALKTLSAAVMVVAESLCTVNDDVEGEAPN